jgi:hypothetical protein
MTYVGRRFVFTFAVVLVTLGVVSLNLADAETVNTSASVSREAYFTYPITQTAPPLIRNGFPPATACLVAGLAGVPQICGSEAQQVAALLGLTDGLPIPVTPDGDLAQPIALPGTTPVGMFGGQPRYASLLAFNLPALQAGQRFAKFELVLHQNGFNFAVESPATRNLVLSLVKQLEDQDPAIVAEAITDALSGKVPLNTDTITGIEACPITTEWNAGRAQGAALDGTRLPKADCLTGTTAVFNDKDGTVTFDITFAVQAWTQGVDGKEFPNQGIMFRPIGAPNLAYGDPDFSTNWVVSLADSTNRAASLRPRVRYETVSDETDAVIDPGGEVDLPGASVDDSTVDFGTDDGTSTGTAGSGSGTNTNVGSGNKGPRVIANSHKASTPGWLWFLLPLILIFAFVFDESLSATPAALRRRPGALTALEARRAAAAASEGDQE